MVTAVRPASTPARSRVADWRPVALIMFGVGWGANQFGSLLGLYTHRLHLGEGSVQAMFGIYALGLVPGLALGGPASDRYGRRRLALPFAACSALVTMVLMAGAAEPALLYAGRFLAGIVTGAVLAAGTAWVKELSPAAGTRLTALAVSAGFGAGPLTAALVAQWSPDPLVTAYLPHLVIMAIAVPLAFRVIETRPAAANAGGGRRGFRLAGVRRPGFRRWVLPVATWVFAAPVCAFTLLPAQVPVHHLPTAYAGLMTALTLAAGMAAQPVARRLETRHPRLLARVGMAGTGAGLLLAALMVQLGQPVLNAAVAILLGASYGLLLTYSLGEVARMAEPGELAGLTAMAYALVYAGMFAPVIMTELGRLVSIPILLTAAAGLALASLALVSRSD
ncbi:MFS transporter [Actinomadura barringtoniae]|uniref:MFS transporter n=1 Tax=Actinomadura barringtoniae TaxID=1427535 RepID=A0A939PFZ5_9ACTN|nr:MFS transporter [Actinomadura barringtoniae]MBO2451532.1 MFS transporter [Actinomadura barringtoniae]